MIRGDRKWLLVFLPLLSIILSIFLAERNVPTRRDSLSSSWTGMHQIGDVGDVQKDTVNIVFVHGLGSNPNTTWCTPSAEKRVCWISDLLMPDLEKEQWANWRSRSFQFNYNSFWYRDASQYRLMEFGSALQREIHRLDGHFILVGHSYGGLVIKQALILELYTNSNSLAEKLLGVVFLGTPHRGSASSMHGRWLAWTLGLLGFGPNIDILDWLIPDSSQLQDLQASFSEYYKNLNKAYCYEKRMYRSYFSFIPIYSYYIVDESSATFGATASERYALDTNHFNLNKYSQRDPNYNEILHILQKMYQSPRVRKIEQSKELSKELPIEIPKVLGHSKMQQRSSRGQEIFRTLDLITELVARLLILSVLLIPLCSCMFLVWLAIQLLVYGHT